MRRLREMGLSFPGFSGPTSAQQLGTGASRGVPALLTAKSPYPNYQRKLDALGRIGT
jgi:hypothetical protein